MKRMILGVLYCTLWYVSILVGFYVFICPLLPLVFLHPKLYRKWSEIVFGMWEPFPVALMEIFFGIRTVLTGDPIDPFERSVLIMNHRTRLDWNFLWAGLFHCCHPYSHALKYVLKTAVMHVPGPGWVMQTCSFLFIHRNWAKDERLLGRLLQYLTISDEPYQILLFPEGTDLTPTTLMKSHKYAEEHNLEKYYNVLHPRTTGFAFIANKMKLSGKFNSVYDITIGYPGDAPQNESDLIKGKFPEKVHFHVTRYSARELPFEQSELKTWLSEIWSRKENLLSKFYQTGSFIPLERRGSKELEEVELEKKLERGSGIQTDRTADFNSSINNGAKWVNNTSNENMMNGERRMEGSPSREGSCHEDMNKESNEENVPTTSSAGAVAKNCLSENRRCVMKYCRPSHLLYLTFIFWLVLMYISAHQLLFNFYVQIWVLIHTLFFSSMSFLSDGFQHVIASVYFYRYNIKANAAKKDS